MQNQNSSSVQSTGFQIINETDSIIRGAGEYQGNKRTSGDAGLDSDSENETNKFSASQGFTPFTGPKPGKKTRGRVKIEMKFIENKLRRYTTFSKRKTGIMKKAYELSTLTGTQVMLLVASETGHVYTFATRKLQPMITSETGKALIQTCLNSPDGSSSPPAAHSSSDQRMNITGFEETDINNYVVEEEQEESDVYNSSATKKTSTTLSESSPATYVIGSGSNGDIVIQPTTTTDILDVNAIGGQIGTAGLVGAPKIEKQDNVQAVGAPIANSAFLLGTSQAIQLDSGGVAQERASPHQQPQPYKLNPVTQINTNAPNISQQPPQYTDLKPATSVSDAIQQQIQQLSSQHMQQNQQQQTRYVQAPIQQAMEVTSQQNAVLQQAGLAYIPAQNVASSQPNAAGTLVYQTPSGMVYAPAAAGQLGEAGGLMFSLPPPVSLSIPTANEQTLRSGAAQFIIPVPVSLPSGQTQVIQIPVQSQTIADPSQLTKTPENQNT